MSLSAGTLLGPYEILSPIGAGGMGEVYKARDTRLGRIVAIKKLNGRHSARFEQEARAIAALNHPNICQIHDIGPDYLVLEYVEGTALRGPLPPRDAVRLAIQIASALEEAHGRGILHRDLKPANILVNAKGAPKLLDFGLAKLMTPNGDADATKTVEGTILGTAAYMSPEQAQSNPLDERSDVFSFGVVLYEMISGEQAFGGASMIDVLSAVVRDEPRPLQASPEIARLVTRCLRKSPGERFQSMAEIRVALEAISGKREESQPSIAVLPFANMSREADDEYFSDGLAEEIINALTQVSGLKVIARTSAFAFKGKNEDIRKIAETLGVTNVLEGSVRRAGKRLRVTAQLIHAADGTHLWSQRYDREMTDVFEVQDEISAAITTALKGTLAPKPANVRPHEPNLPAYEAFLKGKYEEQKYSPEAYARAEEHFKQAIALDPDWAAPHSYLGVLYFRMGLADRRPISEVAPLARAEARRALELMPSEPVAHALLGVVAGMYDFEWRLAEEHFKLARASESLPPAVHDAYATYYLIPLGRFAEAIQERKKAIAQDPLNPLWHSRQAMTFLYAEMNEDAITEASKTLELDATNSIAHWVIGHSALMQGKPAEALESAEEVFRLAPWAPWVPGFLAGVLAQAGQRQRAEEIIAPFRETMPVTMATYYLYCSEIDAAIDWYERAIEQRHPLAVLNASMGYYKPLRAHPRWPKLAKMMNLPASAS
jgi:serine/threonine protein kinase/Flp pilus assembly protein TadD